MLSEQDLIREIKSYQRNEPIDENCDVFKAYPPNCRHKHTFGRYEVKDGQKTVIMWIDLTEFRKVKGYNSVQIYNIENGILTVTGVKSKPWLAKFAGVC